jgi:hypothetical protein
MNVWRRLAVAHGIAALSVVLPLTLWYRAQDRLLELNDSRQQQAEEIARLTFENERLAVHAGRIQPPRALTGNERLELLSLRSEVGRLRLQTNRVEQLRADNQRLQAQPDIAVGPALLSAAEAQEQLKTQTAAALQELSVALQPVLRRYAADHNGKLPSSLGELGSYFLTSNGFMPGLFSFSFISDAAPLDPPPDALILQGLSRQNVDGRWTRLYARGDGRIVEAVSDNGSFEDWESQQKVWPPATNTAKWIGPR